MRLLVKIALIVLACLLVVGATVALNRSGALDRLMGNDVAFARGERPEGGPLAGEPGEFAPGGRPERGEDHDGPGGWASLLGVVKNVGVVAALVAGGWLLGRGSNWLGGRRKQQRKLAKAAPLVEKPLGADTPPSNDE